MSYLMGEDWRDVFDVVIVQARKPKFFTDQNRPFRVYDLNQSTHVWDKVNRLERGKVYCEVTCKFTFVLPSYSQLPVETECGMLY